jgi:hypothetical protein
MDRYPWKIDLHEVSPAARVLVSSAEHAYIKASGGDWSGLGEFSEWRYIVNMMAERIAELERDRDVLLVELQRSFMKLPTVPGDAIAWDGRNLDPHVVRCADEFAVLREQRDAAHKRIAELEIKVARLTAESDSRDRAIDEIHRRAGVRRDGLCGIFGWIDNMKERGGE